MRSCERYAIQSSRSIPAPFGGRYRLFGRYYLVLVLVAFALLASACGSSRPTKRSASGRKYKPIKCPCNRSSYLAESGETTDCLFLDQSSWQHTQTDSE